MGSTTTERRLLLLTALLMLAATAGIAGLCVGAQTLAPGQAWAAFTSPGDAAHDVLHLVRMPRTILGLTMGAALAASGALVQAVTRNPLADPGLLGVTSGAGFAVTLAAVAGLAGSQAMQMVFAITGAVLAALLVAGLGRAEPLRLVLSGMALSAVLLGCSLGCRLMWPDVFDVYRFWSVGTLAGQESTPLAAPLAVLGVLALCVPFVAGPLDAVALGDDLARTLGARVAVIRGGALAIATAATAVAVATCGPIAFLGLLAPHVVRRFCVDSVPWLVTLSGVAGAALLTFSDVLARVLLPTGEVPVAIITAFLGGIGLGAVMARRPEMAS